LTVNQNDVGSNPASNVYKNATNWY
jgi:hypothetical protein